MKGGRGRRLRRLALVRSRIDKFIQPADGIELVKRAPGTRVPPAPTLTTREFAEIVSRIQPVFDEVADRFDKNKYPPNVYEQALTAFKVPATVSPAVIRRALLWKYGHLRKTGQIPAAHRALIAEIQRVWPPMSKALSADPERAFIQINMSCGGRTRFITAAFLVHLVFPRKVPIIDQHNFRAVNAFLHDIRPMWLGRTRPSTWSDIVVVGAFMEGVLSAWHSQSSTSTPTRQRLDHFLMMYGKALKPRHNTGLQPPTIVL